MRVVTQSYGRVLTVLTTILEELSNVRHAALLSLILLMRLSQRKDLTYGPIYFPAWKLRHLNIDVTHLPLPDRGVVQSCSRAFNSIVIDGRVALKTSSGIIREL